MLRNYLTVSFRNLLKNKFYLLINVTGLGLALATCIVAYLNWEFGIEYDGNHLNGDKIYKVQVKKEADQGMIPYGIAPMPLGPAALSDIGDIKMQVQYINPGYIIQKDDVVLEKEIGFASASFLEMFTFPLKSGDASALQDKKKILLSEEMAQVYFGEEDPLGAILTLRTSDDREFPFIVGGVFEKIPLNSSIYFDALVHFDNFYDIDEVERTEWKRFISATYFYIDTPEQAKTVERLLNNYVEVQNKAREDWKIAQFYMLTLPEFAGIANGLFANWLNSGMHPAQFMAPPIMALLILLIACFNFTNTSIAISSQRIKEIGVRKVMGGDRTQLILQFMGENVIVCAIAIVLSVAIANYLVPAYSAMWPNMDLQLSLAQNFQMYFFLFGLLILTAVLAGAYPAIYISGFEPVKILRGTLKLGGTSRFSKVLLSLQYVFTVMALFAGVAFIQNAQYQETLDLGFNRDRIVGAEVETHSDYLKLKAAMDSNPDIEAIAGTNNHIGRWDYSLTLRNEDKQIESFMLNFGVDYMETMDLEILQGRGFTKDLEKSDQLNSLIVNEKLAQEFGWDDPIGKRVAINDTTTLTVVGVVKNFYHVGFWRDVDPYGIRLAKEEQYNFVIAKVPGPKMKSVYDDFEQAWTEVIPTKPFTGFYQDQLAMIKEAQEVNGNIVIIFGFLAVISVILSGIGLFTLVSLNIIRRIKEIGIRKVLGAPVPHIVNLMNKPFAIMILIGGSIGLTLGYFIVDIMIASIFGNYKPIGMLTFAIPLITILFISMSTSSLRILGAALRNPVDSLRYE